MAKLKEALGTEVHWQIPDWHTKDQANIRIRQLLGDNARYFAPLYVTHTGYYWADADITGWTMLTDASPADRDDVETLLAGLMSAALTQYPGQHERIKHVFSHPTDDYIFFRRDASGTLDVRVTGWGFQNYHRSYGGTISETIPDLKLRNVKVCFSIDGIHQPDRHFRFFRGTKWVEAATDADGYYDFGMLGPGARIQVRDTETETERIEDIEGDTSVIDVDVTQYLTVRVIGRLDGVPVEGATAHLEYGHRQEELTLCAGVAECRLPWLGSTPCTVALVGASQSRQLDKDILNTFLFEQSTPPPARRTPVTVRVRSNGEPVQGENVSLLCGDSNTDMVTDARGSATAELAAPSVPTPCVAVARGMLQTKELADEPLYFDFDFDSDRPQQFEARLRVVDRDGNPMTGYPVSVEIEDMKSGYLTDDGGMVDLGTVESGQTMTVADGVNPAYTESYTLHYESPEYLFVLPYTTAGAAGDCLLRVIEKDGRPSAGATCILSQENSRVVGHLDPNGEMRFSSGDFTIGAGISTMLYTSRRQFPPLSFKLIDGEHEYELREVDGPTPWWKVVLEIIAVLACLYGATVLMVLFYEIFKLFL